jgi:glyoxylase-like metal-dependent hydrolase (beta-lactamase superfamily II)
MSAESNPVDIKLPAGVTVFERGWLSSNNILLVGEDQCALIDTGYSSHAVQTVALVSHALGARQLDVIVNTHLHSDHCGGNAALQHAFGAARTLIPPGQAAAVGLWDGAALTYVATGQTCPAFRFDSLLRPGSTIDLGAQTWEVHGAPGHDPHSVILFEPVTRTLISADALWENGFGVVFPELEGEPGFDEVAKTFDLIESLAPRTVVPGHGRTFWNVTSALSIARNRLERLQLDPAKHAQHAAKVLVKFKLLELQSIAEASLLEWGLATPYFGSIHRRFFNERDPRVWFIELIDGLVHSNAARRHGDQVLNA